MSRFIWLRTVGTYKYLLLVLYNQEQEIPTEWDSRRAEWDSRRAEWDSRRAHSRLLSEFLT
jgi:hypothetical protein